VRLGSFPLAVRCSSQTVHLKKLDTDYALMVLWRLSMRSDCRHHMQAKGEILTHASIGCRVVGPFPLFAASPTSMSAKVVDSTMPLLDLHIVDSCTLSVRQKQRQRHEILHKSSAEPRFCRLLVLLLHFTCQ